MIYAINYRNMRTAIHGLVLFEDKDFAQNILSYMLTCDTIPKEDIDILFNESYHTIEKVDWRRLKEYATFQFWRNAGNGCHEQVRTQIKILNPNNAIDLYDI